MEGGNYGYSREYFDRFIQSQDSSVVNKFQQRYWKTKQTLIKVTGKKEDEHVVASDADLDAKLEVFHSIQRTCMELLKVIEQYQRRICFLSQEENELGRFLRSQGSQDKTRAGKIMQATGKALCFSSQQRLALRNPLCRLYQEVETFRYRAISDTWLTVNRMEQSRTEYRGALLWMKDVSQELDPDTHKQMEKFRKVQTQVRTTKTSFDKLRNDVCQKVDLLGASRCNLLSHVLTTYQTTLLHFWEKTSHTMAAIHESFKGCQHLEFSALKSLQNPMDKLSARGSKKKEKRVRAKTGDGEKPSQTTDDQLISLDSENPTGALSEEAQTEAVSGRFFEDTNTGSQNLLSDYQDEDGEEKESMALLNEILGSTSLDEGDFSREWREVFGEGSALEAARVGPVEPQQGEESSFFLPSHLLDQNINNVQSSISERPETSKNLSAWFNLFADLDPLSNPDAVGRNDKDHELHNA